MRLGDAAVQEGGEFAFLGLREVKGFGSSHTASKGHAGSFPYKLAAQSVLVPLGGCCQVPVTVVPRHAGCFRGHSRCSKGWY